MSDNSQVKQILSNFSTHKSAFHVSAIDIENLYQISGENHILTLDQIEDEDDGQNGEEEENALHDEDDEVIEGQNEEE